MAPTTEFRWPLALPSAGPEGVSESRRQFQNGSPSTDRETGLLRRGGGDGIVAWVRAYSGGRPLPRSNWVPADDEMRDRLLV